MKNKLKLLLLLLLLFITNFYKNIYNSHNNLEITERTERKKKLNNFIKKELIENKGCIFYKQFNIYIYEDYFKKIGTLGELKSYLIREEVKNLIEELKKTKKEYYFSPDDVDDVFEFLDLNNIDKNILSSDLLKKSFEKKELKNLFEKKELENLFEKKELENLEELINLEELKEQEENLLNLKISKENSSEEKKSLYLKELIKTKIKKIHEYNEAYTEAAIKATETINKEVYYQLEKEKRIILKSIKKEEESKKDFLITKLYNFVIKKFILDFIYKIEYKFNNDKFNKNGEYYKTINNFHRCLTFNSENFFEVYKYFYKLDKNKNELNKYLSLIDKEEFPKIDIEEFPKIDIEEFPKDKIDILKMVYCEIVINNKLLYIYQEINDETIKYEKELIEDIIKEYKNVIYKITDDKDKERNPDIKEIIEEIKNIIKNKEIKLNKKDSCIQDIIYEKFIKKDEDNEEDYNKKIEKVKLNKNEEFNKIRLDVIRIILKIFKERRNR